MNANFDQLRHITTYSLSMPYECLSKLQLSYVIFHVMSRLCCSIKLTDEKYPYICGSYNLMAE